MNFHSKAPTSEGPAQRAQIAALTSSLLIELRSAQQTIQTPGLMNEKLQEIQAELENALQQVGIINFEKNSLQAFYFSELHKFKESMIQNAQSYANTAVANFSSRTKDGFDQKTEILNNKINKMTNALKIIQKRIKYQNQVINENQTELKTLNEQKESIFTKFQKKKEKLKESRELLTEKISQFQIDIKTSADQNNILTTQLKKLQIHEENLLKELENERSQRAKVDNELSEVKSKLVSYEKEILDLKKLSLDKASENDVLMNAAKTASAESEKRFSELQNLKFEIDRKNQEIININKELSLAKESEESIHKTLEKERKAFIDQQMNGESQSKDVLKSFEDEIKKVNSELELRKQEIVSQKEINSSLQRNIELRDKEIESIKKEVKDLTDNSNSLKNSKGKIEIEKDSLETQLKDLQNVNSKLLTEIETFKSFNENLISQGKLNEQQNLDSSKQIDNLKIENKVLNEQIDRLQMQIKQRNDNDKEVSLKIFEDEQKLKEESEKLNEKIGSQNMEIQSLNDLLNGMKLANEEKQTELDAKLIEIEQLKESFDNAQNQIMLLTEESKNSADNSKTILEQNSEMKKTLDSLFSEHEQLKNNLAKLQEKNDSLVVECIDFKSKFDLLSKTKDKLDSDLINIQNQLQEKETAMKNKSEEVSLLHSNKKSKKSGLNEKIISLNNEVNMLNMEVNRLRKADTDLKKMQTLLMTKETIEKQNEQLLNQNRILQEEHSELISIAGVFNIEIFDLRNHFVSISQDNEKLKARVTADDKTILDLQTQLKDAENEASQKLSEYENVVEEINSAHIVEIEKIVQENENNLENIYSKASNENYNLKSSLDLALSEIEKQKDDISILQVKNENLIVECESYRSKYDQLCIEIKEKQNSEMFKIQSQLQENNVALKTKNEEVEAMMYNNNAKSEIKSLNNEIESLKNEVDASNKEITSLNNEINTLNTEIRRFSKVNDENANLKRQIEDTRIFLTIVGPLNGEIFDLRSSIQTSAVRIKKMKADNRSLKYEVQRLNREINRLNSSLSENEQQLISLKRKQQETEVVSQTATNGLKTEVSKLFEELTERRKNDSEIAELEKERNQMFKDINVFEEHMFDLNKHHEMSLKQISSLRNEMIEKLNLIESLRIEISEADENINSLISQVSSIREENDGFKKENSQLNSNLTKLNTVNNKLSDKVNSLAQINNSLKQENSKLSRQNDELHWNIQKNTIERDMMAKKLTKDEEVNAAIEQLKMKVSLSEKANINLEKELENTRNENRNLAELVEKATADQTSIRKLEDEKLELMSRVSLLEGQLQLRAVKMKDAEIASLEEKIASLEKNAAKEVVLNQKIEKLEEENEKLRGERDVLDLKAAELEADTVSKNELISYQNKCEELEEKMNKLNIELDQVTNDRNVIDLKFETSSNELENTKKLVEKYTNEKRALEKREEELRGLLAEAELRSTQTDTANLHEKKICIRLQSKISELESIARSLQSEKASLLDTIDELHQRHNNELSSLSNSVAGMGDETQAIAVVANLNGKISEIDRKRREAESRLSNEAADHLNTKRTLLKQSQITKEIESRLRQSETNYSSIVKTLTKIFECTPTIASIITAAGKAKGQSKLVEELTNEIRKAREECEILKRKPSILESKLKEVNLFLNLEKKKNSNLQRKMKYQQQGLLSDYSAVSADVLTTNDANGKTESNVMYNNDNNANNNNENLMMMPSSDSYMKVFVRCVLSFIDAILSHLNNAESERVSEIKSITTIILSKIDSNDFQDEYVWINLAEVLLASDNNGGKIEQKDNNDIINEIMERINIEFFAKHMNEIYRRMNDMQLKIGGLNAKMSYTSLMVNHNYNTNNNYKPDVSVTKSKIPSKLSKLTATNVINDDENNNDNKNTNRKLAKNSFGINNNNKTPSLFERSISKKALMMTGDNSIYNNVSHSSFTTGSPNNVSATSNEAWGNFSINDDDFVQMKKDKNDSTPRLSSQQKMKKRSPFRTPLGLLNDTSNLSNIENNGVITKAMSKIPTRFGSIGAAPPGSKNFH